MDSKNKSLKKALQFSARRTKIGIIGIGYVGNAVKYWFEKKKYSLFLYDKYKEIGSPQEVNKADIVFICVPTPFKERGKGYDDSAVREVLRSLSGKKIVVIKSTILPGSTEKFQKKLPQHKILFNPEFLRESHTLEDFLHPDKQIVGYTQESENLAKKNMKILPSAPWQKIMPAKEAEMIKFMANSFLAMKVVFANEFYELCQKLGINYEEVKAGVGRDKRIGPSHFDIFTDNYQGYGGSCFPKDINSLIQFADSKKVNLPLLKAMRKINRKLLKKSGLREEYFLNYSHRKNEKK